MNFDFLIPLLESAFASAARASLGAGILILIGGILFVAFPKIFSPRWRCVFGIVILARLLLPFSLESQLSVFNLWKSETRDATASTTEPYKSTLPPFASELENSEIARHSPPAHNFVAALSQPKLSPSLSTITPVRPPNSAGATWPPRSSVLLPFLWLFGAIVIFGWALARNLRFSRMLRRQGTQVESQRLLRLLDQSRESLGVHRTIPLVAVPRLQCAAIFGWPRPTLLIAENFSDAFNDSEIRGIFLHELAHVRRHDVLWNWLAHLALALHWFNPLVWFGVRRFRADREQVCDAMVLERLSLRQRRHYGATLISLVEKFAPASGTPVAVPALSPFLTRKSELKNRIAMINQKNKPSHWSLHAIAALALASAGAITFTAAVADDDEDERKERREVARERQVERDGDRERPEARERRDDDREHGDKPRRGGDHDREHDGRGGERGRHDLDPETREFIGIIEELKEQIGHLAREGKEDQAHQLEKKIHEMFRKHPEQAERFHAQQRNRENGEIQSKMRELTAALKEALEEGNEGEAREIREHMEEVHHAVRRRDEGEHAERRIHHLRQAAENLAAAGLHDQARELAEQAEEIEQELRHHHAEGRDEELARHAEHLEREVAELKEVIGDLREHVEKLEKQLGQSKGERD